jgi:tetratricopeptide (TPR) repeat protein
MARVAHALLSTLALTGALCAQASEAVPDAAVARSHIEHLITGYGTAQRPGTIGLLHDAVQLAIGVGAPAYNNGDLRGCSEFYAATATELITAFGDGKATSPAAERGLADLRAGLKRGGTGDDPQRRAWAMRLAFDQISVAWSLLVQHGEQMGKLGAENFHRGNYEEAEVAYGEAQRDYDDVRGETLPAAAAALRLSPLLHAQALLELGRYAPAASVVAGHSDAVEELRKVDIDIRALYGNALDLERTLLDLEHAADDQAHNADLRFLFGYQLWFSGRHDEAIKQFTQALAITPRHTAALLFQPQREAQVTPVVP